MNARKPIRLDAAAQERAQSCLRLAYQLAGRYSARTGVPLEDAEDVAIDTLLYTAVCYDPTRGANYCTFAHLCICHRLKRLGQRFARRPRLLHFSALGNGEDDRAFDPADKTPAVDGRGIDVRAILERVEGVLPSRLYRMVWLYYAEGLTLVQVGRQCGICKERVRQLLAQARWTVRAALAELWQEMPC